MLIPKGYFSKTQGRRNLKTLERRNLIKDLGNMSLDSCAE